METPDLWFVFILGWGCGQFATIALVLFAREYGRAQARRELGDVSKRG